MRKTYAVTVGNPNPSPGHVSIVEEETTTQTFFIDVLGSLTLNTFDPVGPGQFIDPFDDSSLISATTSTEITLDQIVLAQSGGQYEAAGTARSVAIGPNLLVAWDTINFNFLQPTDTDARFHVYYFDGADYVLVPDGDLPNNAAGLTSSAVDISTLSPITYATLQLEAALSTVDVGATPAVEEWSIDYFAGPIPRPNVDLVVYGDKNSWY